MYEYPEDKILKAAVEEHGVGWLAEELGIAPTSLRHYLRKRGLPTRQVPKKLELSEALKKVADKC